jgi:hypothetical protein
MHFEMIKRSWRIIAGTIFANPSVLIFTYYRYGLHCKSTPTHWNVIKILLFKSRSSYFRVFTVYLMKLFNYIDANCEVVVSGRSCCGPCKVANCFRIFLESVKNLNQESRFVTEFRNQDHSNTNEECWQLGLNVSLLFLLHYFIILLPTWRTFYRREQIKFCIDSTACMPLRTILGPKKGSRGEHFFKKCFVICRLAPYEAPRSNKREEYSYNINRNPWN